MSAMTNAYLVARIGKPHGLRGEVTVDLHTDDPDGRFRPGARYDLIDPSGAGPRADQPEALTVRSSRRHRATWLVAFDDVPDRTAAERLRGLALAAAAPGAAHAEPESWYPEELVGFGVELPDGQPVGTVAGLDLGAAQDRLVVERREGGTAYVPFVHALVPVVDPGARRVVIDPPAGLLELAD